MHQLRRLFTTAVMLALPIATALEAGAWKWGGFIR